MRPTTLSLSVLVLLAACKKQATDPEERPITVVWEQTSLDSVMVYSFAVNGTNLFAGTAGGGVFLSTNNGTSWREVNSGLTNVGRVNSFAVSGTNVFAGTDSGVFLSTNNGASWTQAGMTYGYVYALAVSPNGAGGTNIFAGTTVDVFLSTGNGSSWLPTDLGIVVSALAVSPNGAGGTNIFAGGRFGAWLSTDNGTSWTGVNTGLSSPDGAYLVTSLAVSEPNLYAGIYGAGVFFSTNNGTSWTAVNAGLESVVGTWSYVTSFAVSPTGMGGITFLGLDNLSTSAGGVFLSTDNGTSWREVNSGLPNIGVLALAISGANIFAGTEGGVFKGTIP